MKRDNMAANYATLQRLNQEGNMAEFQHKLGILKSEKDLYFERFELIEEYVTQLEQKEEAKKTAKKDHSEFIEKMKKDREDRENAIKQREQLKKAKEDAKALKLKEEAEEAQAKKKEGIQQKMQDVHDKRQEQFRIDAKKIRKYQKKHAHLLERKPIYEEMQEKFRQSVELPQIENREKVLASIKEFRRPMDAQKLQRHSMSYSTLR